MKVHYTATDIAITVTDDEGKVILSYSAEKEAMHLDATALFEASIKLGELIAQRMKVQS